jgi:hypothetical protein
MSDLDIDRDYRRGDRGTELRLVQEWLALNEFAVVTSGKRGDCVDTLRVAWLRLPGSP